MQRISLLFWVCFASFATLQAQNLQRIGHLSYSPLTLAGCWHFVDHTGGEWALVGTSAGLSVVDLSDPTQPVERFKVNSLQNNWREVKTWAGYAYFCSEAIPSGVTIVNLNYLPDSIPSKVWEGDGAYAGKVQKNHALQAEDGYLYLCGGANITNGVVIASLSDPWNPHIISKYSANYVHDCFVRGDTMWTSEIYQGQFGVVDITDRNNPVLVTTHPTPGAFNHNSGLSNDQKTLFTTDEVGGAPLAAFDVSHLDNIQLLDEYLLSKKPQGEVHNVRVVGEDFLVCPSYRGQLSIVDGSRPSNLIEIAWDSLGNSLVWDADPYLPSGIIIATAKNEGLSIYKPNYVHAARLEGLVFDAITGFPLADAKVFVLNTPNADTTGADGVYQTGAAASGIYVVRAERAGYQTRVITNVPMVNDVIASFDIAMVPLVNAVEEVEDDRMVQVSPNPFVDVLRVKFDSKSAFRTQKTTLQLCDLSGKALLQKTADMGGSTVLENLGQLPSGPYVLRVTDEKGVTVVRNVVKK